MAGNNQSGRPAYCPTDEDREKVNVLKACGMHNESICLVLGISLPTLLKHFSLELENAVANVKAEILMARYEAAKKGKVPAQNKVLEMIGAVKVGVKREPVAPKLGKKEQQHAAAGKVSNKFAVPDAPRLVVDNK